MGTSPFQMGLPHSKWELETGGFGCRMTMALGNTPATQGQSQYKIKSGLGLAIFKNSASAASFISIESILHKILFPNSRSLIGFGISME